MAIPVLGVVHVNVNCSDLARSLRFYRDQNPLPQDGAGFGLPGRVQWDAHLLHDARGPLGPAVDLLEWKQPLPVGKPAAEPNQLGLFRLAFLVEDTAACHAELLRHGAPTSAPVWLEMGPEVPIAGLWAVFFRDPDGTCLELIQRPELRPGA